MKTQVSITANTYCPLVTSTIVRTTVAEHLKTLESLGYGWGEHGTELPIRQEIPSFIREVLLNEDNGLNLFGVDVPSTVLTNAGTVILVFERFQRKIEIEVPTWGVVCYAKTDRKTGVRIEGTSRIDAAPAELLFDSKCELEPDALVEVDLVLEWLKG